MMSDEISMVLFPVEFRARMEPPLPREYAGNIVVLVYARATVKELQDKSFSTHGNLWFYSA